MIAPKEVPCFPMQQLGEKLNLKEHRAGSPTGARGAAIVGPADLQGCASAQ